VWLITRTHFGDDDIYNANIGNDREAQMDITNKLTRKLPVALAIACLSNVALAQLAGPAITPYRPGVSDPAQLPYPGQLEFELGFNRTNADAGQTGSLPYLLKLAFNPQWGVMLGGNAYASVRDDFGQRSQGFSNTYLELKRAFLVDSHTAFGIEFIVDLPSSIHINSSGKTDVMVNTIYSQDIGSNLHMDANLNLTRLGAWQPGTGRNQLGWAAAFSTNFTDQWGGVAELSGTHVAGTTNTAQLLVAATYSPTQRAQFDLGLAYGVNTASGNLQIFGGMVVPLANFWWPAK
jgi:hypothetical protein